MAGAARGRATHDPLVRGAGRARAAGEHGVRQRAQLLDILQTQPDGTQRVVLIDFPHKEMKSVGFVTRVIHEQGTGRELAAVYVPTTPNPTSGYLEIVPVELLTPTDWTRGPGDALHHFRRRGLARVDPVLAAPGHALREPAP